MRFAARLRLRLWGGLGLCAAALGFMGALVPGTITTAFLFAEWTARDGPGALSRL